MHRRAFIRNLVVGFGGLVASASLTFDAFAKSHGLRKVEPFPVWSVRWKRFYTPGWVAKTRMNIPEGRTPPYTSCWDGKPYDLFRVNPSTLEAIYVAR